MEERLLALFKGTICSLVTLPISFIDLGPGDGSKSVILLDEFYKEGKLEKYVAVDVQQRFLDVADTFGARFTIPTRKVHSSFENVLVDRRDAGSEFIYLGATYGNFLHSEIDILLHSHMRESDLLYLSSALVPDNIDMLVEGYSRAVPLFFEVAKLLHLPDGGVFHTDFCLDTSAVEISYIVDNTQYVLGASKKHAKDSFRSQVEKYFTGDYFVFENHIGFVGRKK